MDAETFRKICEYKQEINRLLAERPELRPLQEKIDKLMAGAGNQHNRCVLITQLMRDKLAELGPQLETLQVYMGQFATALAQKIKAEASNETDQKSD